MSDDAKDWGEFSATPEPLEKSVTPQLDPSDSGVGGSVQPEVDPNQTTDQQTPPPSSDD